MIEDEYCAFDYIRQRKDGVWENTISLRSVQSQWLEFLKYFLNIDCLNITRLHHKFNIHLNMNRRKFSNIENHILSKKREVL